MDMNDPTPTVLEIWADILATTPDELSADDDFFDIGGSSLAAAGIQLLIRERLGVSVPLGRLLDGPTPRGMATAVTDARRTTGSTDALATEPAAAPPGHTTGHPRGLSSGQERLWFLHRLMPESAFYHVPLTLRLAGELDVEALSAALDEVLQRHEVLRTAVVSEQGRPVAEVRHAQVGLPVIDLSSLPPDEREARLGQLTRDEALRPFDLTTGPMLRAGLLRLSPDDHLLVLVVHHIAYDGASQSILFRDLSHAYRRALGGHAPMQPLPAQYGDYVEWQRSRRGSAQTDRQIEFWRERLDGTCDILALPTDRPRPAHQSFRGAVLRFALPADLSAAVLRLARAQRSTPFMLLLAAFSGVLGAYSGTEDVVIGVPAMSRGASEFQDLIGFFINTLPLRCDLSGDPSFAELLGRVRETCISAYEHQDVPFETLVEQLRPQRDLSRAPIVQVLASWEEEAPQPEFEGLQATLSSIRTDSTKLDLSLFLRPTANGIAGAFEYSTDLFDERTVQNFADSLVAALTAVVADPQTRLHEVPLLSAAERDRVLHHWNDTTTPTPTTTVHDLVITQAHRTPDATAVRTPTTTLTYRQLLDDAHHLAATLQHHGARPGTTIGILAPRTPQLVTALLATLITGAAYTPLDPEYPANRLHHMIQTSHITTVLTHHNHPHITDHFTGTLIPIDTHHPHTPTPTTTHPQDLAYTIYTSGSTGTPKGIDMPHQPLVNLLLWQLGRSDLKPDDATLQFPAFSFDMSFLDIFYTLVSGRTLVFAQEQVRRDPVERAAYMAEQNVGCFVLSPAALYQQAAYANQPHGTLPGVREIISAGEQLVITDSVREMFADRTDCVVVNQYGPTETHCMTAYELQAPAADWPASVPIGRPIANTRAYVLDERLRPLPAGIPGELYLAGACLARGYTGQPALTADRFVPDPYAPAPGARMYRTGDQARWRPDGNLEYLGRLDHQLKIRGFRIEPAEVEKALAAHPGVLQSVVVTERSAPGADQRLIAYVVGDTGPVRELRAFLRNSLPDYLIPDVFEPMTELPLTPSGKIDRNRLPAVTAVVPQPPVAGPGGAGIEHQVHAAWAAVLGHDAIDREDSFFEIGGNSLRATQLHGLLQASFQGRVAIVDLFRYHTIAALTEYLAATANDNAARQSPPPAARRQDRLRSQRSSRTRDN
ncbi:amino acid adenylation domain-containing protein [Kitasatospora sp. GAS1066B]